MPDASRWRLLLPTPIRTLPADLVAVVVAVVVAILAVFLPVVNETPLRIVVGLPFVLFIPGYALIAALFPEAGESPAEPETDDFEPEDAETRSGIDGIERLALSFGLSIAVVPLIGLALNFTPWGIRLTPIMVSLSLFTLLCTAVAAQRRRQLPSEERFAVPYREWYTAGRAELFHPDTRGDAVLNVLLVVSVLLAVGSIGYAVGIPKAGESFSEFYLLTEDDDGDLVADDYPTEFTQGESKSLIVGIGNQEHEAVNYTVVVELQRVQVQNNSTMVLEERSLKRFQTRVAHNETWHLNHSIAPQMTGENLRLTYLLYTDDPPQDPTVDNAYRELHLWVNVSSPSNAQASNAPVAVRPSRSASTDLRLSDPTHGSAART
jgi:uncharacterized membrane protein